MQFTYDIAIPINTTEDDPYQTVTRVCVGRLVKTSVYFPWGCAGLAGVRIIHFGHQLFPTNRNAWFKGNEILIEFACNYIVVQGWNQFKVEGYNEDDFYVHTPIVNFTVLSLSTPLIGESPWIED